MTQRQTTSAARSRELDGLRGFAVLLVLIWHYYACQIQAVPGSFARSTVSALGLTWSGVDLFFVLSGFLITGILLDNREAQNYFSVFYIRRTCRIMPIYYLYLALFLAITALAPGFAQRLPWLFEDAASPGWYLSYTQNFDMARRGDFGANWLGITWSLAIEEQFYLCLPALLYVLPRRTVPSVFSALFLMAPILRFALPGHRAYVLLPWRIDSLMAGALLAWAVRDERVAAVLRAKAGLLRPALVILAIVAAVLTWRGPTPGGLVTHTCLTLLYAVLLAQLVLDPTSLLSRFFRIGVLVELGAISYGVYMYHQAVSGLVHWLIRGDAMPRIAGLDGALASATAFVVTLAVATLSYRLLERRAIRFGHAFHYRTSREPAAREQVA
jgi:peptidoglycan/LPS O-acetylase OafA/YrhL